MAAGCFSRFVVCLFVLAALIHCGAAQTRHVVGDSSGWATPSAGASTYSNWAASQTFKVGDTLVFNFVAGGHDVRTVTKAAFDACDGSNPIGFVRTISPTNISLTSEGEHYYLCGFSGHCMSGQKLAINVVGSSTSPPTTATPPGTSPPTTETPPGTSTMPPPTAGGETPSSAPALAGFSAIFLSAAAIAVMLL